MGGCFSSSSSKSSSTFNSVRLVHLSGYVEDFEQPIYVSQVTTGNPPKHFVCTTIQLLSSSAKPLKGDTQLQLGHVYFILPYSILQADVSPVDLASLSKRLTAIAKTNNRCEGRNKCRKASPFSSSQQVLNLNNNVWDSPSRGQSPCRWKPILDTIREKSFNRRSESDLQEHN